MTHRLLISSAAEEDIHTAYHWYLQHDEKLAERFEDEIRFATQQIQLNPEQYQVRYSTIRVKFLDVFPFGIHYHIDKDSVTIISVFHTSLSPSKWDQRRK
ncbi:MAG: type II toxin-antitoxin system RelE/ParE family toxin [Cyclobacteriaceae bacterium]